MKSDFPGYKEIVCELSPDEDGYPPDKWERLWAQEMDSGLFSIDNIPFFLKGISPGDIVSANNEEGELRLQKLVTPSTNSVFRLFVSDVDDVASARQSFRELGCESEQSHIPKLVAIEVPGGINFEAVAKLLDDGLRSGRWEYEEGVLRHPLPQ
ncbi:MAG TPA: DUF4265 domain-containing protein [Terriglobales bacterium]|jgi:hypothetical protein